MNGSKLSFKHPHAEHLEVEEFHNHIYIHSLVIQDSHRGQGIGSNIMKEIIAYSKTINKPLVAFVSHELGGDVEVLFEWYKKLGFYPEVNMLETDFNYNMRHD